MQSRTSSPCESPCESPCGSPKSKEWEWGDHFTTPDFGRLGFPHLPSHLASAIGDKSVIKHDIEILETIIHLLTDVRNRPNRYLNNECTTDALNREIAELVDQIRNKKLLQMPIVIHNGEKYYSTWTLVGEGAGRTEYTPNNGLYTRTKSLCELDELFDPEMGMVGSPYICRIKLTHRLRKKPTKRESITGVTFEDMVNDVGIDRATSIVEYSIKQQIEFLEALIANIKLHDGNFGGLVSRKTRRHKRKCLVKKSKTKSKKNKRKSRKSKRKSRKSKRKN